jgi:hypothetical protein
MSLAYLDLNDSTLRLQHDDRLVESPGYALYDGRGYTFGSEARGRARLRPRDIATRFWWQLDTRPLQPSLGPARHSADLVHQHLQQLHAAADAPDDLLLAAPGSMQDAQLSLLLGIIQKCPFRAVGLVHRSVAVASLFQADGPLFHLELQLHQALLTELRAGEGVVRLQRETVLPGCGLLQLQERLVETLARAFIRQTRFDPRRRAESEQQLYDALHTLLHDLRAQPEALLEIQGHRVRIGRVELADCSAALRDSVSGQLAAHRDAPLLMDPLVALLPGLGEAWRSLQLDPADLFTALAAQQARLLQEEDALVFVSELPLLGERGLETSGEKTDQGPASDSTAPDTTSSPPLPTHLLRGHKARPLADGEVLLAGWQLRRSKQGWHLQQQPGSSSLQLNGQAARDGDTLRCGDYLQADDGEPLQLIAVGE